MLVDIQHLAAYVDWQPRLQRFFRRVACVVLLCWSVGPALATCKDNQGALIQSVTLTARVPSAPSGALHVSVAWYGWIIQSPGEFSKTTVNDWVALAQTCAEQAPAPDIIKLQVFTNQVDADRTRFPPKGPHGDLATWLRQYDNYKRQPMAQVILFGKTVVSAYLVPSESAETEIYGGISKPIGYELVDVAFQQTPSQPGDGDVTLFLKTSTRVSPDEAVGLADSIAHSIRFPNLNCEMRPDRWFIESLNFPLVDGSQADRNKDDERWSKPAAPSDHSPGDRLICRRAAPTPQSMSPGKFSCFVP